MSEPNLPVSVYQVTIVLCGVSPMVWWRPLVRSDTTIAQLHQLIQTRRSESGGSSSRAVWSNRSAPSGVHGLCCYITMRRLPT
jgi:hypothetical protein